jgi:isoquinoline 1-oxidoreductase subunit beta
MAKLLSRRSFLITGAALAGVAVAGVAVGAGYLASLDLEGLSPRLGPDGRLDLNAFVSIASSGEITVYAGHLEMGQGIQTGAATLVAEELGVDPALIKVLHPAEPLPAYGNYTLILDTRPEDVSGATQWVAKRFFATLPYIGTGGSTSIKNIWVHYRLAGATARELLIDAAAKKLNKPRDTFKTENGFVIAGDGSKLSFGELAALAVNEKPRDDIKLKAPSGFKTIGKDVARVDLPAKVSGKAVYGIDAAPEGLIYAAAALPPPVGGKLKSFDEAAARAIKGVIDVVAIEDKDRSLGLAVVANSYWTAKQAVAAAKPVFEAFNAKATNEMVVASLVTALKGDMAERIKLGSAPARGESFEAAYETVALAHACMEPMSATILHKGNGDFEVWGSAQSPVIMTIGVEKAAAIAGFTISNVTNHVLFAGGGFGRKSEADAYRICAVLAAKHTGKPVKLIYSREDDIGHGTYLPFTRNEMKAVFDGAGKPVSLAAKVAGASVQNEFGTRWLPFTDSADADGPHKEAHHEIAYQIPHHTLHSKGEAQPLPTGYWRANGNYYNGFAIESFIDECAHRAKADPLTYRHSISKDDARLKRVYEKLALMSGWAAPLPAGRGRGIAAFESYGTMTGVVVEVSVTGDRVTVDRIFAAADPGIVINPGIVRQQIESSIIWGLSAALSERLTLKDGVLAETNFDSYPIVTMAECPEITVEVIVSDGPPGGVGETAVGPLAPALANAIFAASGRRIRSLPLLNVDGTLAAGV